MTAEKSIIVTRLPYEEPYEVNLVFNASNGLTSGQVEIYDIAERLKELADILEDFPFNSKKTFLWELGSEKAEDNFAFYLSCPEIGLHQNLKKWTKKANKFQY